ncbi:MAG: PH domain-containing protein [Chromatiaceae bacterium]|nr:PH domain-containing protein [Chromatiaceae bacterium]
MKPALTEYEYEPVPGLPERLPPGEEILWQGAPRWQALARRAFHVRKVAAYFVLLLILHLVWEVQAGEPLAELLTGVFWLVVSACSALGLLALLARSMARSTLYTITNRRVVMRFGVAIPMTINLPFAKIVNAALRDHGDGTGDIVLSLAGRARASYLVLWPHTRPWHFAPPEPMLRAIPDATLVARRLAAALADNASGEPGTAEAGPARPAPNPPSLRVAAQETAWR